MKYIKMHGAGNDYIFADCMDKSDASKALMANPAPTAIKISDRHFGVGADGLILICPSEKADCEMKVYNADGSYAYMCGNGVRCVGKYIYDSGYIKKDTADIESGGSIKHLTLVIENGSCTGARVNMGRPQSMKIKPQCKNIIDIEPASCEAAPGHTVKIKDRDFTLVSMGNPHAATFVDSVDTLQIEKTGPDIENDSIFPDRANVEFIEIIGKNMLKMRVWERGSGETLACGTGACASAVAAVLNGYCEPGKITVNLKGGALIIEWDGAHGDVYMTGPAEYICEIKDFHNT